MSENICKFREETAAEKTSAVFATLAEQLSNHNYRKESSSTEQKYEVDFLIVKNKRIVPIEVKSSSYRQHESIDCFVKK